MLEYPEPDVPGISEYQSVRCWGPRLTLLSLEVSGRKYFPNAERDYTFGKRVRGDAEEEPLEDLRQSRRRYCKPPGQFPVYRGYLLIPLPSRCLRVIKTMRPHSTWKAHPSGCAYHSIQTQWEPSWIVVGIPVVLLGTWQCSAVQRSDSGEKWQVQYWKGLQYALHESAATPLLVWAYLCVPTDYSQRGTNFYGSSLPLATVSRYEAEEEYTNPSPEKPILCTSLYTSGFSWRQYLPL